MNEFVPVFVSMLNALLFAAVPVLVVAGIVAMVMFARRQAAQLKAEQPALYEQIAIYARIAVEAAQQAGIAQIITDKKKYAVEVAQGWLDQVGLHGIDVKLIAAEVERQYAKMKEDKATGL